MLNAKVIGREIFVPSHGQGLVTGASYYTSVRGNELLSIHSISTRSDLQDVAYLRRSQDNGRTWSSSAEQCVMESWPEGTWRCHNASGFTDPRTDRFIQLRTEGVLPSDEEREGLNHYALHYSVFENGAENRLISEQVICQGSEYNAQHPIPGVVVGRNGFLIGDLSCVPIALGDGTILQPFQITPVDESGNLYNPAGGLKYRDSAVLHGTWRADGGLNWEVSERIQGDPSHTTRGVLEPTIAELPDERILMVMRGSNDTWPPQDLGDPDKYLPGYKWHSFSSDGGHTWSTPLPWTDSDGNPFYSPSSCSQLVPHSSGRLFWFGNVTPHNPVGNGPRHPMVIAEVDTQSGLIIPNSFAVVDDKREDDAPTLQLSCFHVREDRETGHLLLHMPRMFAAAPVTGESFSWNSDLWIYRIDVKSR